MDFDQVVNKNNTVTSMKLCLVSVDPKEVLSCQTTTFLSTVNGYRKTVITAMQLTVIVKLLELTATILG